MFDGKISSFKSHLILDKNLHNNNIDNSKSNNSLSNHNLNGHTTNINHQKMSINSNKSSRENMVNKKDKDLSNKLSPEIVDISFIIYRNIIQRKIEVVLKIY